MICLVTSCSTSTKVIVSTEPGTEILTPSYTKLAVADNNGQALIKISDDIFYSFLLSHHPNSDDYIPFALDYKYKTFPGSRFLRAMGYTVSAAGVFGEVVGIIALCAGSDDIAIPFLIGGAGAALLGVGVGLPADSRLDQTNHEHLYKYLKNQCSNSDLTISKADFSLNTKQANSGEDIPTTSYYVPVGVQQTAEVSTTTHRKISQKSARTLKDYGSQIQGDYVGSGKLTKDKELLESYTDIKVIIKRVSNDVVSVNVEESNGQKYFPMDVNYKIEKKSDGSFILTLDGISVATIKIDNKKNLIYLHPRVNIDGDIYTLSINGKKQ